MVGRRTQTLSGLLCLLHSAQSFTLPPKAPVDGSAVQRLLGTQLGHQEVLDRLTEKQQYFGREAAQAEWERRKIGKQTTPPRSRQAKLRSGNLVQADPQETDYGRTGLVDEPDATNEDDLAGQDRVFSYDNKLSLKYVTEVETERPAFLRVLPSRGGDGDTSEENKKSLMDRLWVTSFWIGRRGQLSSIKAGSNQVDSWVNKQTRKSLKWPNEVEPVPSRIFGNAKWRREQGKWKQTFSTSQYQSFQDALLVADGFLVPGKDRGGIYVVKNPGSPDNEETVSLTKPGHRWFYHKANWVDLTGDGRLSILTARCKVTFNPFRGISTKSQLVALECPKPPRFDEVTNEPLNADGTAFDPFDPRYLPWKEHVLAEGPDTMFSVVDMDESDDTIEVICTEFFNEKVTIKSIRTGGRKPKVVFERTIDDSCGKAYSCIPADLECGGQPATADSSSYATVIESGSTVPGLKEGDQFSHLLVTNHNGKESTADPMNGRPEVVTNDPSGEDGGSLFAYKVPRSSKTAWKTEPWERTTVATGFKVPKTNKKHPGAPGFVYTFQAQQQQQQQQDDKKTKSRPLIAVAGDCTESAYVFRPNNNSKSTDESTDTSYKLAFEIKCGSTVGSLGIGYDNGSSEQKQQPAQQQSGGGAYAKLYVPLFEKDKVLVYSLGESKP